MSSCVQEETVIVDEGDSVDRRESQGGREWERVVIVDRGESQGLFCIQEGVVIRSLLCLGGRCGSGQRRVTRWEGVGGSGGSGQRRVTRSHVVSRRAV